MASACGIKTDCLRIGGPISLRGGGKMAKIEDVLREQESSLMDIPGVTGVGQTEVDGKECIVVMMEQSLPEIETAIPSTLEGYPVVMEVSGVIQALREQHKPPSG
jgi:hypothetical protein